MPDFEKRIITRAITKALIDGGIGYSDHAAYLRKEALNRPKPLADVLLSWASEADSTGRGYTFIGENCPDEIKLDAHSTI